MPDNANPKTTVDRLIDELQQMPDPLNQALAAGALMEVFKQAISEAKNIRFEAVETLSNVGWGYQRIAESLSLSKPRIQQILNPPQVPSRPGILQQRSKVLAAEMRAKGQATDGDIAEAVINQVRHSRGGTNWSTKQIATWADIDESFVKSADTRFKQENPN